MDAWQNLMYVRDGVLILGAVSRETGEGLWQAWRIHPDQENELIGGEYASAEAAQRAVEEAC